MCTSTILKSWGSNLSQQSTHFVHSEVPKLSFVDKSVALPLTAILRYENVQLLFVMLFQFSYFCERKKSGHSQTIGRSCEITVQTLTKQRNSNFMRVLLGNCNWYTGIFFMRFWVESASSSMHSDFSSITGSSHSSFLCSSHATCRFPTIFTISRRISW